MEHCPVLFCCIVRAPVLTCSRKFLPLVPLAWHLIPFRQTLNKYLSSALWCLSRASPAAWSFCFLCWYFASWFSKAVPVFFPSCLSLLTVFLPLNHLHTSLHSCICLFCNKPLSLTLWLGPPSRSLTVQALDILPKFCSLKSYLLCNFTLRVISNTDDFLWPWTTLWRMSALFFFFFFFFFDMVKKIK